MESDTISVLCNVGWCGESALVLCSGSVSLYIHFTYASDSKNKQQQISVKMEEEE